MHPIADARESLEGTRLDMQSSLCSEPNTHTSTAVQVENEQYEIPVPEKRSLPTLTHFFHKASCDYGSVEDTELSLRRGDLIECLGRSSRHWFLGRLCSGRPEGNIGRYPDICVTKVDPIDPAFHEALALTRSRGVVMQAGGENPAHIEHLPWGTETSKENWRTIDRINEPLTRAAWSTAFDHGVSREGNGCGFPHDVNAATFDLCQQVATGACRDATCRLPHRRHSYPGGYEKYGAEATLDDPRIGSMPQINPVVKTESFELESFARHATTIQPVLTVGDLPDRRFYDLPGDINSDHTSPSYLSGYTALWRDRDTKQPLSKPFAQAYEDGQHTPPMSFRPRIPFEDHPQVRSRQLRSELFDAGKADLFYTLTRSQDSTQPKTAVLNIAALQHMSLHQLQYDISYYVESMFRTSHFHSEAPGLASLAELMSSYCDALRNLDYMKQCATRGYEEDPFLMKSSRALERSILEATKLIPNHVLPAGSLPLPHDYKDPQLRDVGRNEANKAAHQKDRLRRFTMAGIGALLLVVPMLIMANIPGKTASLVTTCVALLIFSILIPLLTELGPNEILATTAAYAAVLVVFVGTSLTTNAVVVAPTA